MRPITILPALLLAAAACGTDPDPGDDPGTANEEPPYFEACAATEIEGPEPNQVEWTFLVDGDRFTETGDDGEVWEWVFSPTRRYTSLVLTESGAETYRERREFDAADREITFAFDGDGAGEEPFRTTRFSYEGDLLAESTTDEETDGTVDSRTTFTYDGDGNEISRDIDDGDDGTIDATEERSYDGDLLIAVERDIDNDGAVDETEERSYDAAGDLVSLDVVDASGEPLRSVSITRDGRGNITERIDERFNTGLTVRTRGSFDERDRVLTSGFDIEFNDEVLSTSDFTYRYECP